MNYASFALTAAALGGEALREVDAIWVYNSPATVSVPMLLHSRLGRTPVFLHVQDLWPDSLIESGMFPRGWIGRQAERMIAALVRLTERRAAVIGVSSESVRDIIIRRNPKIEHDKIIYAPNPTNEELFLPVSKIRARHGVSLEQGGRVEVMYAGALGDVQGLDTVLDAAALLQKKSDVQVSIVGDGISRARLEGRVQAEGLTNVRFLGRVEQTAMPELMARAHIQLVSLADAPFLAYTTPSKIATILASGTPIIGHLTGDGARMIEASGAGVAVNPGDAEGLATAILEMAFAGPDAWRAQGQRGRAYYESNLAASKTAGIIINALKKAAERNSSRGLR